jgi:hypothetical protein
MYRDTYIKLILKELLNDPYLSNIIYQIILNLEMNDSHKIHRKLSIDYKGDIRLLYPGFLKTGIFENIQFNDQYDIDPGFTFYMIQPLISCGYHIDWSEPKPIKYISPQLLNTPLKSRNGINLINVIRKKYPDEEFKKLIKRINRHHSYELHSESYGTGKGIWYDFDKQHLFNL